MALPLSLHILMNEWKALALALVILLGIAVALALGLNDVRSF